MNNPESTLITKIHYLISQRRLFGEVKARGEEYYRNGNVETIFSPRPEELLAVVSEKKKHVVFMMLERGTLKMACSCGGMSPCKHAAAVSYYVADHRGELDSECLLDSFIKKQIEYSLIEMITFLNRLVGPQKLVTPMTEVDYYTLIGDFAILFVEELLSDIDKKMLAKYVLQYLSIASSASYFFCIQDTVFMNERIMIVLEAIFSLTEETENNFVEGLTKYLFLIDSND